MNRLILVVILYLVMLGCSQKPKFSIGDYVMPSSGGGLQTVIKIVGSDEKNYSVFEHYLSSGKLIQVEDYKSVERVEFEKSHIKVEPPRIGGSFSPDQYLSK